MPKTGPDFDASQYASVADRIALFYERFPDGRIVTRLVSRRGGEITFLARVYRTRADCQPSATGWASERIGDGDINSVACLENTETSAVGRALANLGLTASRNRPSVEEMTKAARARARLARDPGDVRGTGRDQLRPRHRAGESDGSDRKSVIDRGTWLANAALDTLRLLGAAERAGLDSARVRSLDAKVRGRVSLASLERVESVLRKWLLEHVGAAPPTGGPDVKHISL